MRKTKVALRHGESDTFTMRKGLVRLAKPAQRNVCLQCVVFQRVTFHTESRASWQGETRSVNYFSACGLSPGLTE